MNSCFNFLGAFSILLFSMVANPLRADQSCDSWPHWESYKARFIQPDGRVVEYSAGNRTTSEAQSYALFFSMVANDRDSFEKILDWTNDNLANGELGSRLPAWLWGLKDDQKWGVIDSNSASDSDIWIAYVLLQAGRSWNNSDYTTLGDTLLRRIKEREVLTTEGGEVVLLPGENGFQLSSQSRRLNPSYTPPFIIRYFSHYDSSGPWSELLTSTYQMLRSSSPHGLVPDWIIHDSKLGYSGDKVHGTVGSFDAIRVYLWLGLTHRSDQRRNSIALSLDGMYRLLVDSWIPPMFVDALSGGNYGAGTTGFYGALIPYLGVMNDRPLQSVFSERVKNYLSINAITDPVKYYDYNLSLFGLGSHEQYFEFDSKGQICTRWSQICVIKIADC